MTWILGRLSLPSEHTTFLLHPPFLSCVLQLGSLGVFLVGGSALECVEAGRRTSAFMQTSVLSDANKQQVMTFVDQGTQQVPNSQSRHCNRFSVGHDWTIRLYVR